MGLNKPIKIINKTVDNFVLLAYNVQYLFALHYIIGIISIDIVQEWKTDKTINALKDLSAPHITVLRDGKEQTIASADLARTIGIAAVAVLWYEIVKLVMKLCRQGGGTILS